jgi:hypothetical protein
MRRPTANTTDAPLVGQVGRAGTTRRSAWSSSRQAPRRSGVTSSCASLAGVPPGSPGASSTTTSSTGAYRATLRTPDGTPVGWFQVKLDDEQPSPVMYEAVLPPQIDEGLAAATAAALGKEVDWIDRHTLENIPGTNGNRG